MEKRIQFVEKVQYAIAFLSSRVQVSKKLTDANIIAEDFFKELLNITYELDLKNVNVENKNAKSIDLIYPEKQLAYQITSQNTTAKIKKTVKGFIEDKRYKSIKKLIILTMTTETKCSSNSLNQLDQYEVDSAYINLSDFQDDITTKLETQKLEIVANFLEYSIDPKTQTYKSEEHDLKTMFANNHIVDQLYGVLKLFDGLQCIHPRTLAKLWPFNSDRFIFDSYSKFCLKTDNIKIHHLLEKIEITSFTIKILDEGLEKYSVKLHEIFKILNHSLIHCICYREKYIERTHHNISIVKPDSECQCNYCRYNQFNIVPLMDKLKSKCIEHSEDPKEALSEAYYLQKIGEPVESWRVLNKLIPDTDNLIINYIAQQNSKYLYSSINTHWFRNEAKLILPKIDQIDLFNSLANPEYNKVVRDELIRIKEDEHLHFSRRRIEELSSQIKNLKKSYLKGSYSFMGPSYITQLLCELMILKGFYVSNHISIDYFSNFRNTITKGIDAIFASYTTSERLKDRYIVFDENIISIIMEYVSCSDLENLIKEQNVEAIRISNADKSKLIIKIKNFFEFQYNEGAFDSLTVYDAIQKQEYFSRFRQKLNNNFNKIMLLLSYSNFSDSELKLLTDSILKYLKSSEDFYHFNWRYLREFLIKRIQIFKPNQIISILHQALTGKNHRQGEDSLGIICSAALEKCQLVIDDDSTVQMLMYLTTKPCTDCKRLHNKESVLALWKVFDDNGRSKILAYVEQSLGKKFDGDFYQNAAFAGVLTRESHPHLFSMFVNYTIKSCSENDVVVEKGMYSYRSYVGINALSCLYHLGLNFEDKRLSLIAEKSLFYSWILSPSTFDYENFKYRWLLDLCNLNFHRKRLKGITPLRNKVRQELDRNFDSELASFYVKYLTT